jgi:hypothetical protein
MAEFYIEKKTNGVGEHIVHSSICSSLPPGDDMRYLGAFSNAKAPVSKALNRYLKVSTCPSCLPA